MQNFHLSPDGNSWKLTCGSAHVTVENFDTKEAAIEACTRFLAEREGSLTS